MRITRTALIHGLLAAANRERERRQAAEESEKAEARRAFYDELDEMAARARAVGAERGWREPTPEERAAQMADLDEWARDYRERHGG
jgi:hypothetical protein